MRGVLWLQHGNKQMSLHFWGVQMKTLLNGTRMKNTSSQFDGKSDETKEISSV
jgi:hypothetical protein